MIQANQPIAITLAAERWNQVIAILSEALAPHRVTDPLIREIHAQCIAAADQPNGSVPQAIGANNITQLHEAGC